MRRWLQGGLLPLPASFKPLSWPRATGLRPDSKGRTPMIVGIVKESFPNEARVAMVPALVPQLAKADIEVVIESGAGFDAGFLDEEYSAKGAKVVSSRAEVFQTADLIAQVRALGANPEAGKADLELMRDGQAIVGMCEPLTEHDSTNAVAQKGAVLFSMEMMPRITRAQSMDVLSSMATIAGYKAVLLAANELPKMFPMMMTAAGTIAPARVFVVGAGVPGDFNSDGKVDLSDYGQSIIIDANRVAGPE